MTASNGQHYSAESIETEDKTIVRFAIPKKGRLYERITQLLSGIGLSYKRQARLDIAFCTNFPVQLVFLPAKDIATFVGQGDIDLGITGQDIVAEAQEEVDEILQLGFGKCKLCVQTPAKNRVTSATELIGKRICTSFPVLARQYFINLENEAKEQTSSSSKPGQAMKFSDADLSTKVKFVSGSVEAACSLGLADAVIDLVESGTTMRAAGLEMIDVVMKTEAVLIGNKKLQQEHKEIIGTIKKRIEGYLSAKQYKMMHYNIKRDLLPVATAITPGRRAPSVTQLDSNWVAVGAMVKKEIISETMDKLQDIGATDIFVVQLDNCRV